MKKLLVLLLLTTGIFGNSIQKNEVSQLEKMNSQEATNTSCILK